MQQLTADPSRVAADQPVIERGVEDGPQQPLRLSSDDLTHARIKAAPAAPLAALAPGSALKGPPGAARRPGSAADSPFCRPRRRTDPDPVAACIGACQHGAHA
jgi:hypothetical protein